MLSYRHSRSTLDEVVTGDMFLFVHLPDLLRCQFQFVLDEPIDRDCSVLEIPFEMSPVFVVVRRFAVDPGEFRGFRPVVTLNGRYVVEKSLQERVEANLERVLCPIRPS